MNGYISILDLDAFSIYSNDKAHVPIRSSQIKSVGTENVRYVISNVVLIVQCSSFRKLRSNCSRLCFFYSKWNAFLQT